MRATDPEYSGVIGRSEARMMTRLDEYKLNEAFNCIDGCYHEVTGTGGFANVTGLEQGKTCLDWNVSPIDTGIKETEYSLAILSSISIEFT